MNRIWIVFLFTCCLVQPVFSQEIIPPESSPEPHFFLQAGLGLQTGAMFQGYAGWGRRKTGPSVDLSFGFPAGKRHELTVGYARSRATLYIDKAWRTSSVQSPAVSFQVEGIRNLFSARWNYIYRKRDKHEIYLGLRMGLALTSRETNTGFYDYTLPETSFLPRYHAEIKKETSRPAFQLILFGFRVRPTKNMALGGELAIGAPYYAGVFARFCIPVEK